jgi:hypothetical protein
MADTAPTNHRRWFQFSSGTLFWLMLVTALGLFGLRERRIRLEYEARDEAFYEHRNTQQAEYERQLELHKQLLAKELAEVRAVHPNFQTTPLKINPQPSDRSLREW